jgi:hypothetical protein
MFAGSAADRVLQYMGVAQSEPEPEPEREREPEPEPEPERPNESRA